MPSEPKPGIVAVSFRDTLHQFRKRRVSIALDEPRVARFSPRGDSLPGVFVGIGQRAENHFGKASSLLSEIEQALLAGEPYRTVAKNFAASPAAVFRHGKDHVAASPASSGSFGNATDRPWIRRSLRDTVPHSESAA
jgi:hypothetical protein